VLARARAAGVRDVIITGTSVARSAAAQALCTRLGDGAWCTAGVHPHDAAHWDDAAAEQLAALAAHPRCVAIGCAIRCYAL
jgi:TatD DNase family protein